MSSLTVETAVDDDNDVMTKSGGVGDCVAPILLTSLLFSKSVLLPSTVAAFSTPYIFILSARDITPSGARTDGAAATVSMTVVCVVSGSVLRVNDVTMSSSLSGLPLLVDICCDAVISGSRDDETSVRYLDLRLFKAAYGDVISGSFDVKSVKHRDVLSAM